VRRAKERVVLTDYLDPVVDLPNRCLYAEADAQSITRPLSAQASEKANVFEVLQVATNRALSTIPQQRLQLGSRSDVDTIVIGSVLALHRQS